MQAALLELMWEQHRAYLRRLLLGMTRDVDRAEDLLQETYCRAHAGFGSYRGANARAWLAAIARNVWRGQQRRPGADTEGWYGVEAFPDTGTEVGTGDHVRRLAVREATRGLTPRLREALALRHTFGLSYEEIGQRCSCPTGTARRRVWTAIRQLRAALGVAQEVRAMRCEDVGGMLLLEYAYGSLPNEESAAVSRHLDECPACRAQADEVRGLLECLDTVTEGMPLMHLTELDAEGLPVHLTWGRLTNDSAEPLREFGMLNPEGVVTERCAVQHVDVPVESRPWPAEPGGVQYVVQLPEPVPPGESFDAVAVSRVTAERAEQRAGGSWRYAQTKGLGNQRDAQVFVVAVRLPEGGRLLSATPEPDEAREAGRYTTVVWRLTPAPQDPTQFSVEYRL